MSTCSFERLRPEQAESPTLIEGLPGHGLVASIAVDRITDQLDLELYGGIRDESVPPVLSFRDGLAHDTVRVYAGADPDILTLQSDVLLPEEVYHDFSQCVLTDLAPEISKGIFIAAAPAQSEEQHGEILGVATDEEMRDTLRDAGVNIAEGDGVVGGITGALVDECFHTDVQAALLLVRADPHVPDPHAAHQVITHALEPLVDFEIDTEPLIEQAKEIQQRKAQIAQQLTEGDGQDRPDSSSVAGMFQ